MQKKKMTGMSSMGHGNHYLNLTLLTPISDQNIISPYNINTSIPAMRIKKTSTKGLLVDPIPNYPN